MIIVEGREFSPSPVWARGGQAPLRAQISVLTVDGCSSADLSVRFGVLRAWRAGRRQYPAEAYRSSYSCDYGPPAAVALTQVALGNFCHARHTTFRRTCINN